jgi:hypothetical protein
MVKASPHWVIFNELGELILADLSKEGYKETARAMLMDPTSPGMGRKVIWSHPAFANKCVFARNDKQLICVSLEDPATATAAAAAPPAPAAEKPAPAPTPTAPSTPAEDAAPTK